MARLTLRVPKPLARFIAQKGSVALDGVSLTVNDVTDDTFSVLIIPHTLGVTTFGALKAGDTLNLEVDVMARYAARLMETSSACPTPLRLLLTPWQRRTQWHGRAGRRSAETGVKGARILVVEARYYDDIADMLLRGAKRVLKDAGATFDVVTVPGALEIPPAIMIALHGATAREEPYDGVVALGCVIRGETSHYDIVAGESARGLMDISIARDMPMGNGILTVDTDAQARARARPTGEDKGGGAARAALTLVRLKRKLCGKRGDEGTGAARGSQGEPPRRRAARRRAGTLPDGYRGDAAE